MTLGYIGPGAGIAVFNSLPPVVAATVAGGVGLLTWPLRSLARPIRLARRDGPAKARRVVILGEGGEIGGLWRRGFFWSPVQ